MRQTQPIGLVLKRRSEERSEVDWQALAPDRRFGYYPLQQKHLERRHRRLVRSRPASSRLRNKAELGLNTLL